MKLPRRRRLAYLWQTVMTIGCVIALAPTPSGAAEIKILTSRAMNHVLTDLAEPFRHASGHKLTLILAPPAEIMKRIDGNDPLPAELQELSVIVRGLRR